MSTSDLYMVFRTTARHLRDYPNCNGSAPVIWAILCEDYLHLDRHAWIVSRDARIALDKLVQDPRVPLPLRLVQAMCLEDAVIRPEDLAEMAAACRVVYDLYRAKEPHLFNHWRAIGADLARLATKRHGRAIGYGLSCSSSCDDWIAYRAAGGKGFTPFDCVAYAKTTPAGRRPWRPHSTA